VKRDLGVRRISVAARRKDLDVDYCGSCTTAGQTMIMRMGIHETRQATNDNHEVKGLNGEVECED
jgi:hypothetical protein